MLLLGWVNGSSYGTSNRTVVGRGGGKETVPTARFPPRSKFPQQGHDTYGRFCITEGEFSTLVAKPFASDGRIGSV